MAERIYCKNGQYIREEFIPPPIPDMLIFDRFRGKIVDPFITENDITHDQDCRYLSPLLYFLARTVHARTIVEIGVAEGTTTFPLLKAASEIPNGMLYSVDPSPTSALAILEMCSKYKINGCFNFYNMTSNKFFSERGKDIEIDFAFIDGDHSYECVKSDLENCLKRLVVGGIIIMHDLQQEHENSKELNNLPKDSSDEACPFAIARVCSDILPNWDVDIFPLAFGICGLERHKEWTEGGALMIRKRKHKEILIPHGLSGRTI